ncbi:kinase-like domain-containing protein [Clohesyomyces aquaticus]|uniref:Kinase-like domain-containing protein n=1 Tax=Clohesyomyces aquaticus TaxID=1231657 RepID=A0A1Y1Z5E5_9PLEO|nr:kinase-like domain-containing protein [Clohesyomyces aquaticus]
MMEASLVEVGRKLPKIISYGEHPDKPYAPVSILMTQIPGRDLVYRELYEQLSEDERETAYIELHFMLEVMRKWSHPCGGERICSVLGTAVRSSESEFNGYLFSTVSGHSFPTRVEFEEKVETAKKLQLMHHPIVFTHGDLKHHNIMVHNGYISAFLDWESAGWYPDYWEYTTPPRFGPKGYWWTELVMTLGGEKYLAELESEEALVELTVDSWLW